jgi:hypothetical protein
MYMYRIDVVRKKSTEKAILGSDGLSIDRCLLMQHNRNGKLHMLRLGAWGIRIRVRVDAEARHRRRVEDTELMDHWTRLLKSGLRERNGIVGLCKTGRIDLALGHALSILEEGLGDTRTLLDH